MMRTRSWCVGLLGGAILAACGDSGGGGGMQMVTSRGSVSDGYDIAGVDVHVKAGIGALGLASEALLDGWTVDYTKVLVALGDLRLTAESGDVTPMPMHIVVDLTQLTGAGLVDHLDFRDSASSLQFTVQPVDGGFSPLLPWATDADVQAMLKEGAAVLIEGSIAQKGGQSCTPGAPKDCVPAESITFRWVIREGAQFLNCAGFAASTTKPADVTLTLPAISWLKTSFLGSDSAAPLRAQWIADVDLNHDGESTLDEMAKVKAGDLFTAEMGYDLSRAPGTIDTAQDFLVQQVRTIGVNAWGYCLGVSSI